MSKSNLKNINKLSTSKIPYIFYINSDYANILYKLKKSVTWHITETTPLVNSYWKYNSTKHSILVFNLRQKIKRYGYVKQFTVYYNPNNSNALKSSMEIVSKLNYKYLDLDVFWFFEKKRIALKKKQKKEKELNLIYKKSFKKQN